MTQDNWKTLRVPSDKYQQAKEQKEEHNRTWGQQLVCNNTSTTAGVDREALAEDRQEQLEKVVHGATNDVATVGEMEDVVEELRQLSENVEVVVEELQKQSEEESVDAPINTEELADQIAKNIKGQITDLEHTLPSKIVEELR